MSKADRLKIYVVSRASIPTRPQMWRGYRQRGARIVSSWIDEAGPGETKNFPAFWERITAEIRICHRLVLYAEAEDFPLKGALIEVGMALALALALALRKSVWVVAAPGIVLDRTDRPFGSWIRHPWVERIVLNAVDADLAEALGL
jgi:hypothetical protein